MIYNNIKPWTSEVKRVFVNEIYSYAGQKYQNKSGRNSTPAEGSDWIALSGSGGGASSGIITDLTLQGDGTEFEPVGLSQATVDLINSKTVTTATQTEVENQTPPPSENRKFITLFNIWKWRDALSWLILKPISTTAIANRLRSNGSRLFYANNSAVESEIAYRGDLKPDFTYTPTGNFSLSQIKTLIEANNQTFNGILIHINNTTNAYICTLDIGASSAGTIGVIQKTGTGTISFQSVVGRTFNTGVNNITILNGNASSFCHYQFSNDTDFIKIKNY